MSFSLVYQLLLHETYVYEARNALNSLRACIVSYKLEQYKHDIIEKVIQLIFQNRCHRS